MTLGDVIAEYRKITGMSMERFAELSGMSKGYVSMLERNKTQRGDEPSPSFEKYRDVAKAIGMDVDELIRKVDGKISLGPVAPNILPFTEPLGEVIQFSVIASVSAGYNGLAQEEYSGDTETLSVSMLKGYPPEELRVFRVHGDSMYPRFMDGDRVLVHLQSDVDDGDTAIVIYNGDESTIKRVYRDANGVSLVPFNPEYQTKRIEGPDVEQVRIFGKIIKLIRDV